MVSPRTFALIAYLSLICYANATLMNPMNAETCDEQQPFTRVMLVNYDYEDTPVKETQHEQCKNIQITCCTKKEGMFDNLNHYWQKANNEQNYSVDLDTWSQFLANIWFRYREIFMDKAKALLKTNVPAKFKKRLQKLVDTPKSSAEMTLEWIKKVKNCFNTIKLFMHGIMCSMCSPETSYRIEGSSIKFDNREAAYFGRECGPYILEMREYADSLQVMGELMNYDDNGEKQPMAPPYNFLAYWNSDKEYTVANIKANIDNCKMVSNEFSLTSVNPSSGCDKVIQNYMGIGPLVKFDQKIQDPMSRLYKTLKVAYDKMISAKGGKSRKLQLQESSVNTPLSMTERILDGGDWNYKDGIDQLMWKNRKQFQSVALGQGKDLFEQPLFEMGQNSGLNGFEIDNYQIFKESADQDRGSLAKIWKADVLQMVNIRDPSEEKMCPATINSSCADSYYNELEGHWKLQAEKMLQYINLEAEIISKFYEWLTRKNEKGELTLVAALKKLDSDPKCDWFCQTQKFALLLHIDRIESSDIPIEHLRLHAKCMNAILHLQAMWRCPICDDSYRSMIVSDSKTGRKDIQVNPRMCTGIMELCDDYQMINTKLVKGAYDAALNLIKSWENTTWNPAEFRYRSGFSMEDTIACEPVFKKFKGVERSPECIKICETQWEYIFTPKPPYISQGYRTGLMMVMEKLGPAEGDKEFFENVDKKNAATNSYMAQFQEIDFPWKSRYVTTNDEKSGAEFYDFQGEPSPKRPPPSGNGLSAQRVIIPKYALNSGLLRLGTIMAGLVSLLVVVG